MNPLKMCCILFLGLFLPPPQQAVTAWTQTSCAKVGSNGKLDKNLLDEKAKCMSQGDGAISKEVLDKDKETISEAYPGIEKFYGDRRSSRDLAIVVSMAWTKYRSENREKNISTKTFIQLSTSYGQLTVNSTPTGASIAVDSKQWDGNTNETAWTEAGERKVQLTKKDCNSEEGKAVVTPGGDTTFERTLKCK